MRYFNSLKKALNSTIRKLRPNLICVNEMGFPAAHGRALRPAVEWAQQFVDRTKTLLFAGTYHDVRTGLNTGFIFVPNDHKGPIRFNKQISAWGSKEHVAVQPNRCSLIVRAFGLNIAVLVCLDIQDFSSVAPLVRSNRVDLLLLPCYSPDLTSMSKTAEVVSAALPGAVALVNCHNKGRNENALTYKYKDIVEPSAMESAGEARITTWDLSVSELTNERDGYRDRLDKSIEWLFGLP